MQTIIDNKQVKAESYLASNLIRSTNLSVITGHFSIYAFEHLEALLPLILKLRLLFSVPIDTRDKFAFIGNEDERKLRNTLNQQYVAKRCLEWLTKHAEIVQTTKMNLVGIGLFCTDSVAMQGSVDLTATGLGVVHSGRYDMILGHTQCEMIKKLGAWFERVWSDQQHVQDIKKIVLTQLAWMGNDKEPLFIYHFILYHLFNNMLEGLDEEKIIKTKTGIKEHAIWQKLYKFQKDGVLGAIDKLERYNGCIIADSVGLGKTFEALAVIKYYELRNDRVLVLCPRKLRDNWTIYLQNDKRNIFCEDRFGYDVLNHTDLNRGTGSSGDINLATINWGNYDLVVIDESHNFRNNPPNKKQGLSRYKKLMKDIIKAGVKTKVLMLSATPVNSKMNDLKNQVAFITEGIDNALFDSGISSIENTLRKAQTCFNQWLDTPERSTSDLLASMNFDYFHLLDLLTIARSRKHIEKYYNIAEIGKFPERLRPMNIKEDIDVEGHFPPVREVNKTIQRLHLAAYSPLKYVLPEKREEYNTKYDIKIEGGSIFRQTDREESLIHLMRINLLKRMESSINSFGITVEKLLHAVGNILHKIENFDEVDSADMNINDIEIDSDVFADYLVGNKIKVLIKDCDIIRWQQELRADREQLVALLRESKQIVASRDKKLQALKSLISHKKANNINAGNQKIVIFTAFVDTATYLYDELANWAKETHHLHAALVVGSGSNQTNLQGVKTDIHSILTHFSPKSKERAKIDPQAHDEIDLLFATDCISEGQNLQDCDFLVNYDIHWNPVRIIQRFGRIDRIGSTNTAIQLVNFWPNIELDEYINLEARVAGRMVLLDISATGEENVIDYSKQMNDLEYRRKQLQQLQDAVLDLEDISGGISITDLTLNDFKIDLASYLKKQLPLLEQTPFGARTSAMLELTLLNQQYKSGAIFCLQDTSGTAARDPNYSLSPFYLVFVADNGTIQLHYTQPKHILDLLKKQCIDFSSPQTTAVDTFNRRTQQGKNMRHYQGLLEKAVESIIGKQQEQGVKSLFERGGIRLTGELDGRIEQFEVVAFIALLGKE